MRKILVLGAGRSSSNLIRYLLECAAENAWVVRVGDLNGALASSKVKGFANGESFEILDGDIEQRREEISAADLVISMLPAFMHVDVAKVCITYKKHIITPSYVSEDMWQLDEAAKQAGVLILNEMGVDPGIDHMSAMAIVHDLSKKGAVLSSFESFTGGLIAPESDNNPWNYKITWNPRNVVLAGYGGTARFLENNTLKFIPYHRLFSELTTVEIDGYGTFEGYANRDSVKYKSIYGLSELPSIYRGTLRRKGFCSAWNALLQMGLTDDSFKISNAEHMTWRAFTSSFILGASDDNLEKLVFERFCASPEEFEKLKWLGLFDEEKIGKAEFTPAEALQMLIEKKWVLESDDKDMIVMWHRFHYEIEGKKRTMESSMVCLGDDPVYTAMSKTVGLPIAIAAKFILNGTWNVGSNGLKGVQLPITPVLYEPVLHELTTLGIRFTEKEL